MQKIIFIHLLNDYSGSPKVLSQVIRSCLDKGIDTDLYYGCGSEGFLTGVTSKNDCFFYKRFDNKFATLLTYLLSQVILFIKLLKYINDDIVIYVNTMLPFGAALAAKVMGKPVYYHIHETSLQPLLLKNFLRFVVRMTASKVIYVSKSLSYLEHFPIICKQVIYNSLSRNFIEAASKSQYSWKNDDVFSVLMLCSLKGYKGIDEFVQIARKLEDKTSIRFNLILNANQSEIDDYFSSTTLPINITLYTRQKNTLPFYAGTSLLLNLSKPEEWVETFGLTILEAMSFGIPVIVPPIGGPAEIVRDGKDGYLISCHETSQISEKIIELSNNSELCLSNSYYARKRSLEFGYESFDKKILSIICE